MAPQIISVVTPSYNQGEFIEATIRSILCQEGEFFIDYIIMDGGSDDASVSIIETYEKLLAEHCDVLEKEGLSFYVPRDGSFQWNRCLGISYRWCSEKDRGQVHALKKGFALARGSVYCWLNSDDIYLDHKVYHRVRAYFRDNPDIKLLTGDGKFISREGTETGLHRVERINPRELLYLDYHILQPSTFFHPEVYGESSLDEQYVCAFDADYFIRLLLGGVKYKKIEDYFAAFRFYPDTKTMGMDKLRYKEQMQIAAEFSKSRFFLWVSRFYRFMEIRFRLRYYDKSRLFKFFYTLVKRACYLLITGKTKR